MPALRALALALSLVAVGACHASRPPNPKDTVGWYELETKSESTPYAAVTKQPEGAPYTAATIDRVWEQAEYVGPKNEQGRFRKDRCGAWINLAAYGDRDSQWGWEIGHVPPLSQGGTASITNLRPLHWLNNAARVSGRSSCAVTARGVENVAP